MFPLSLTLLCISPDFTVFFPSFDIKLLLYPIQMSCMSGTHSVCRYIDQQGMNSCCAIWYLIHDLTHKQFRGAFIWTEMCGVTCRFSCVSSSYPFFFFKFECCIRLRSTIWQRNISELYFYTHKIIMFKSASKLFLHPHNIRTVSNHASDSGKNMQ